MTPALKNLKSLYFNGLLLTKYIMFEHSKYRGVMFDGTQDWYKIRRKTHFCFQKWHEEIDKFSPEHVRKSKNWDTYLVVLPKVENISALKFRGGPCVMRMKNDSKFELELTCQFKIDMRHLANFHQTTLKNLKIGTFIGSFY